MNFLILLTTGLLLAKANQIANGTSSTALPTSNTTSSNISRTTETSTEPLQSVPDLFKVVHVLNKVKSMLSDGSVSYAITWDESLAAQAADRIQKCPRHHGRFEIAGKFEELIALGERIDVYPSTPLNSLPTLATKINESIRIELDIGTRIGCAHLDCSGEYDILCRHNLNQHEKHVVSEECVSDEKFPKLCVEQPFDYWRLWTDEAAEFRTRVIFEWNERRSVLAKALNSPAMYQLKWSFDLEKAALADANSCHSDGNSFAQPRALEPISPLYLLSRPQNDFGPFGEGASRLLSPGTKAIGCAPTDPSACHLYSYICHFEPLIEDQNVAPPSVNDKLCGDCPGVCIDGLCCVPEKPTHVYTEDVEPLPQKTSTTPGGSWVWEQETWKVWAMGICIVVCVGLAFLLMCTLVTTDYDY
ncbi:unnamed protein product [Caenorhabditis sp. 36 PRJEB53466]|nr:unnamed protein product [Caenorhabditis sp. 36 PRJEB53466]